MGDVSYEQANLFLKLYDLRREAKLREAREWFGANFHVKNAEEALKIAPFGSKENAYLRMVVSYWDMVGGIVERGLIDEGMLFESTGEPWNVWEQFKPMAAAIRAQIADPQFFSNLEELHRRQETWREKRAPGSTEAMRKFQAQVRQQLAGGAKAQAA